MMPGRVVGGPVLPEPRIRRIDPFGGRLIAPDDRVERIDRLDPGRQAAVTRDPAEPGEPAQPPGVPARTALVGRAAPRPDPRRPGFHRSHRPRRLPGSTTGTDRMRTPRFTGVVERADSQRIGVPRPPRFARRPGSRGVVPVPVPARVGGREVGRGALAAGGEGKGSSPAARRPGPPARRDVARSARGGARPGPRRVTTRSPAGAGSCRGCRRAPARARRDGPHRRRGAGRVPEVPRGSGRRRGQGPGGGAVAGRLLGGRGRARWRVVELGRDFRLLLVFGGHGHLPPLSGPFHTCLGGTQSL